MVLNEENVLTVKEDTLLNVYNPGTGGYTPCRVELGYFAPDTIFLTTLDSRVDDYNNNNLSGAYKEYRDYIQHMRNADGSAVMRREEIAELLINKQYTIS